MAIPRATSDGPHPPRTPGPPGTEGLDLHLDLRPGRSRRGLRQELTDALREAVRHGRLAPGTRLPSSRSLAADLGIARNTVADAYADLVAEGWFAARQGSGTRVAPRAVTRAEAPAPPPEPRRRPALDLRPGTPDLGAFPRAAWLRAARRALSRAPADALGYGDPHGRPELRAALAAYLARARGVRTDPGRVLICSGTTHGLMLLGAVLRRRGVTEIAVESYGLREHWARLTDAGLRVRPVPLDASGADIDAIPPGAGAVLLTPAHQFPLGDALSPRRRAAVLDWARRTGGLVIEDDYDGEFRYDRQLVGALQGLDPGLVVHAGTTSKSLAPGLRLGWLALPGPLVAEAVAAKGDSDWSCGVLDQLTLAEFLTSGAYDRHVRAMRLRHRRRRDGFVAALAAHVPHIRPRGIAAGLHAVLDLPPGTEQAVVTAAARHHLVIPGLGRFRHPDATTPARDALVIGYTTPGPAAWPTTLNALVRALS